MMPSRGSCSLVLACIALCASAAPPVNVGLKAAFGAPPYLVELLETAAEENATAYFPLLDRIAEGHFDAAATDKELHETFLQTLQDDGHIHDPEALSSYELALALHSAAPRIEAHYQYYHTAVEGTLANDAQDDCESWVHFNGKQFCSPDFKSEGGKTLSGKHVDLPFDRVLGDPSSKNPSILYADITSQSFRQLHATIRGTAAAGKTSYRIRHKPSRNHPNKPLYVSGYGVEMALKRTDYIVIDDREAEAKNEGSADSKAATLTDEEVADLRPLSSSELRRLGVKAATFILQSEDPWSTLTKLSQDFPKHSSAMSTVNTSQPIMNELAANRETFLPPGYNVVWINGMQISARDFEAYAVLELLRKERKLIKDAESLTMTPQTAISLISHPAISDAQRAQDTQRYDWRDSIEGGNVILWLNDIEKDSRYKEYPATIHALLQRSFPGQIPQVRKNIHNVILPVDFSDHKDVTLVVDHVQTLVKRGVPVRFGLVPRSDSDKATAQAKVMYHLLDTYGLGAALSYLKRSLTGKGLKHAHPIESYFDQATKDQKLRRDRTALPFQDVLSSTSTEEQIESSKGYLKRLGISGSAAPMLVNGVPISQTEDWMRVMSQRISLDLRDIAQAVYMSQLTDDDDVSAFLLEDAVVRRNPLIIPEDEKSIKFCKLVSGTVCKSGFIGDIPSIAASGSATDAEDANLVHLVVIADFDTAHGGKLFSEAIAFKEEHNNVEVFFIHSSTSSSSIRGFSDDILDTIQGRPTVDLRSLATLKWLEHHDDEHSPSKSSGAAEFWASADPLLRDAGIAHGESAILINGRIVGPMAASTTFDKDDFEMLLAYEQKKRSAPVATALKELGLADGIRDPLAFARFVNLIALSAVSDVPDGIFDTPPTVRTALFESLKDEHTVIRKGDISKAKIQIVASLDPASEVTQRWAPILNALSELEGVHMRVFVNPKERLDELPVKRFYRYVMESKPSFDSSGARKHIQAEFQGLPKNALLTIGLDMPPAWLVSPVDSVYDLDNLRLSSVKTDTIDATYKLDHILIEGHSKDTTTEQAPRGVQLVLSTQQDAHFADTIIMANLGYFQFKANPGFYNLGLQTGRSQSIFTIDSAGARGQTAQLGDGTTEIALTSFRGATLFPRLSRNAGMEEEDVLEAAKTATEGIVDKAAEVLSQVGIKDASKWLSKAQKIGSSLLSGSKQSTKDISIVPHADINIFSVASGHLYERMLNIMMVSVMKHTSHTVKFWFIEQFLSPSFKAFLPIMAEEYGFWYEMVTYKWPHWLRGQKEKQREIWGYKILFLDVLFPLDLDKVIFVDADQIVRTDMYELVQLDLKGAPYGFTPMCNSRTEMEGFRFWKQGYWKNYLRGLPYHISALYVVDLKKFRQIAAGDRLRQQYHQLSADPNSLSNLDQDLPNHMQHVIPIHSLPQEWLWCETWCSDESLGVARTIDLCNNPQTKEPKLERARRQVPEWTVYDEEIAAFAKAKAATSEQGAPIAVPDDANEQAKIQEEEYREKQREENAKSAAAAESGRPRDEL